MKCVNVEQSVDMCVWNNRYKAGIKNTNNNKWKNRNKKFKCYENVCVERAARVVK